MARQLIIGLLLFCVIVHAAHSQGKSSHILRVCTASVYIRCCNRPTFCHIMMCQYIELKNGTACKEEILQLVCDTETDVLVIHRAVFDGQDSDGCGFLMPINISSLLPPSQKNLTDQEELQEMIELDSRRRLFSVQSTVNRR